MSLAYDAMIFAMNTHKDHKRKYTGDPYFCHLAEVAGLVSALLPAYWDADIIRMHEVGIAVSYLHDTREDHGVPDRTLRSAFGDLVADGVKWLSDLEEGNRATRKRLSRERLAVAPGWVQTIKCADLISNTKSIVLHDPKFAVTYLEEKRLLLPMLTKADMRLWVLAHDLAHQPILPPNEAA